MEIRLRVKAGYESRSHCCTVVGHGRTFGSFTNIFSTNFLACDEIDDQKGLHGTTRVRVRLVGEGEACGGGGGWRGAFSLASAYTHPKVIFDLAAFRTISYFVRSGGNNNDI